MDIELVKAKVRRGEYKTSLPKVDVVLIITVYIPAQPKWIDARTRAPGRERQND